MKHCPLAHVQKWAYIFFDHIWCDLNVELKSGKHFPPEIDVSHVPQSDYSTSRFNDTDNSSYISIRDNERQHRDTSATVSNVGSSSHQWPQRPKSPAISSRDDDFPSLGSHNRRAGRASPKHRSDVRDVTNPWNLSSTSSSSGDSNRRSQSHNDKDDVSFRRCEF